MVLLVGGLVWLLRNGILYIIHPFGFSGLTMRRHLGRAASREQLHIVLEKLLDSAPFDSLSITEDPEMLKGFLLSVHEGYVEVFDSWSQDRDGSYGRAVRSCVAEFDLGYAVDEMREGFGGQGPQHDVEFHVPLDLEVVGRVVECLLISALEVPLDAPVYLSAFRSDEGPSKKKGIYWRRSVDYLRGVY